MVLDLRISAILFAVMSIPVFGELPGSFMAPGSGWRITWPAGNYRMTGVNIGGARFMFHFFEKSDFPVAVPNPPCISKINQKKYITG